MTAMKTAEEYLKPYHLSYKYPSDRDSYSSYREGYSDAMDIAGQAIEQAQTDAYNQAIEDVAKYSIDRNPDGVVIHDGIDSESILKLKR